VLFRSALLRQVVKRDKRDASAWHYLGLAYSRQGKTSDARNAHEKAAKAGEALLMNQFEVVSDVGLSERLSHFKTQFDVAAESAEKYLELSSRPSSKKVAEWRDRATLLREMAQSALLNQKVKSNSYSVKDVTTKARIISRPEPQYTERAREKGVQGTVILRAIFGADGRIRIVRIVKALPRGLTLQAIRAAQQIKFIPAMKDGQPVSQYIQIEYNFNLY
jgi:TonB family protein